MFFTDLAGVYIASFLGALFVVFYLKQLKYGFAKTPRIEKDGGSPFMGKTFMEFGYWTLRPLLKLFVFCKVSPNMITFASMILGIIAGIVVANGDFVLSALIGSVAALLDAMDGMVARERKIDNPAGGIIDSTVDRIVELSFCFGLIVYYNFNIVAQVIIFFVINGSLLVSYASARGEIYKLSLPRGVMRRGERALYMNLGVMFSPLISRILGLDSLLQYPMLLILVMIAVLTNVSAVARYIWLYRELLQRPK